MEGLLLFILAIIIGYFVGKYFTEKKNFGQKEDVINAQWEKKIAQLEKNYELKIEKEKSLIDKIKEENKTQLEKLAKTWEIKYIQDIEELKKLFKESEKIIRTKSVSSSRRSLVGKFIEKFVPFLNKLPYEASDMHFLGQPVDYIVFQGLHQDKIEKVIFVEVKTGNSKLTKREKSLKEAIEKKKVGWKEINIDTADEKTPDKAIENEDTSIDELYKKIEQKVASAKDANKNINLNEKNKQQTTDTLNQEPFDKDIEEEIKKIEQKREASAKYMNKKIRLEDEYEEQDFICPECEKTFTLEMDDEDYLEEGVETDCPYCKNEITLYEDDLADNEEEIDSEYECIHCGDTLELEEDELEELKEERSIRIKCPTCNKKMTIYLD
jgi:predicted Holliday junction resolvase-like endonuclease/DNA-directed RNA polymerase subunit RPC12/RpoP